MAELAFPKAGELPAVTRIVVALVEALKGHPGVAEHVTHSLDEGFAILAIALASADRVKGGVARGMRPVHTP